MQPLPPPVPGPMALLDTTEFVRRKKTALWFVGALLAVSASILTVGLAATTRTENVTVGGYYPGIIRRHSWTQEPRPLMAGRCQFHSSGAGYLHDVHQTEVTCHSLNGGCPLKVKSNTCYCCDLYEPGRPEPPVCHAFVGVGAGRDALQLYWVLRASAALSPGAAAGDRHRSSWGPSRTPSRWPSWPTARPRRLGSSTTPPSRSWPARAFAPGPQPSRPARPTHCPSSCPVASRPHLCPRTHSLSPAPAAGTPSAPPPTSSPGRSPLPTHRDAEGGDGKQ